MRPSKLALALLLLAGATLTGLWLRARTEEQRLRSSLARFENQQSETTRQASDETQRQAELAAEIAAREKILGNSPSALETKRRATALVVIEQIKQTHAAHPPAPREKAPPYGSSGGIFFPELLSDPEYNQLYAKQSLGWMNYTEGRKLRHLGLPKDICEKALAILAEREMAFTDYRQITGQSGISGKFADQQMESTNRQLKELLGEEMFQRWDALNESKVVFAPNPNGSRQVGQVVASREALIYQARNYYVSTLSTRLSYTETPLSSEQANQLAELMVVQAGGSDSRLYRLLYDDAFIQTAGQVLSAPQAEALRQLKAERDASTKRSKLPKSSELPRNTR